MKQRWVQRKAHYRRLKSGRTTLVRDNWARYEVNQQQGRKMGTRKCPECGAVIITVHMPNGGWAHYEGRRGLHRIKHPCMHRGEGLPKGRDEETGDLFENMSS